MSDQATHLRQLVLEGAAQRDEPHAPAPRLLVLLGGKGGVGATTLAVNLAVALTQQGQRSVLVDANFAGPDIAALCRLDESSDISTVLSGQRCVHEVLQRGVAGTRIVPGAWGRADAMVTAPALARLIDQLTSLGSRADWIVVDAGSGATPVAGQFWQAADHLMLVTTPDVAAVMGSYATLKALWQPSAGALVSVVVNQADSAAEAADVQQRVGNACRRFLGFDPLYAGWVAQAAEFVTASARRSPLLAENTQCPAARQLRQLSQWLAARQASAQFAT